MSKRARITATIGPRRGEEILRPEKTRLASRVWRWRTTMAGCKAWKQFSCLASYQNKMRRLKRRTFMVVFGAIAQMRSRADAEPK